MKGSDVMLAHAWDGEQDLTGWLVSEKLDGVRAVWDGKQFLSRGDNVFHAPKHVLKLMPKGVVLDGELWMGRGKFQQTVGRVRRDDDQWDGVKYRVFDAPMAKGGLLERMRSAEKHFNEFVQPVKQTSANGNVAVRAMFDAVVKSGGEGLIARVATARYEFGNRSHSMLKVKIEQEREAVVVGRKAGTGKYNGMMGALLCKWDDGTEFDVGGGFLDTERATPSMFPNGTVITVAFSGYTDAGNPRHPRFKCVRDYEADLKDFQQFFKKAEATVQVMGKQKPKGDSKVDIKELLKAVTASVDGLKFKCEAWDWRGKIEVAIAPWPTKDAAKQEILFKHLSEAGFKVEKRHDTHVWVHPSDEKAGRGSRGENGLNGAKAPVSAKAGRGNRGKQ